MANIWTFAKEQATYLLYGPGGRMPSRALVTIPRPEPPLRTSLVFESHIQEANKGSRTPQTISSAWDERAQYGDEQRTWQGLTPQERKLIMLDIYLNNPWVSACIDVIAKRIFSGGYVVEKIDEEAPDNKQHEDQMHEYALRINPDWDFNQLGRALIIDKLIFGESYAELTWKNGQPWQLFKVDCPNMGYKANRFGQIERFYQQMESTRQKNWLDPASIIRWWFPHPRASIDPFAPAEKVSDAVLLDKKMMMWTETFFRKGTKFPFSVEGVGDQDEAQRFLAFFMQNFSGEKNGHAPFITWGNAKLVPLAAQKLDMDFQQGLDRMRTIIFAAFGVPPAAVSIIETGNIGGGTGEDQDKSLIFNACDPVKGAFFEKLNDRIVKRGMGITDYRYSARYAEYRSDEAIAKVQDIRAKNGTRTVDELRQEDGKRPYAKGGDVPFIWSSKEITPVPRLGDLEDEQKQTAAAALQTANANADLAQTKAKQAKEPPPEPVPPAMSNSAQQSVTQNKTDELEKKKQKPEQKQESQGHTGIMIAFMIPPEIGQKIAIPGGEPVEDLHITLALLGNAENLPVGNIEHLKTALSVFAANMPPVRGRVSGIGRFINQDQPGDEPTPVWASVDMERLQSFHDALIENLRLQGYEPASTFAYQPHITLAYIDKNAPMPIDRIENVPLDFTQMCLAVGDERFYFPLLGKTAFESYFTGKTELPRWTDPDEQEQVNKLIQQGVVGITWEEGPNPCRLCLMNRGVTVRPGMPFPSGHLYPQCHPNCDCGVKQIKGPIQEDKDATQKLPVIRAKKLLSLTENDLWDGRT